MKKTIEVYRCDCCLTDLDEGVRAMPFKCRGNTGEDNSNPMRDMPGFQNQGIEWADVCPACMRALTQGVRDAFGKLYKVGIDSMSKRQ